jgi:hypothetical protein
MEVVRFTPVPPYPPESNTNTYFIEPKVGLRNDLEAMEERKSLVLVGN